MNNAQKVEISVLLEGARKMKDAAETMRRPYHDDKIADYAKAAIADYDETRNYILERIQENVELFLNLHELRMDNGEGFVYAWYQDRTIEHCLGDLLRVSFKFVPTSRVEVKKGNAGGLFCTRYVKPEEISMKGLWLYTSKTEHPAYRICSSDSFARGNLREEYPITPGTSYTAKGWKYVMYLAENTRKQTELLMKSFTELLAKIQKYYAQDCSRTEEIYNENATVGVYVKVTQA